MKNENEDSVIQQLLIEVQDVPEEDFNKWYEKKRKIFNTGVKKPPTKQEFIKYLNYASAIFPADKIFNG
ncbi:MAG: hypothetical protein EVG15_10050 [Candidatus Acididesulfobacter diazotrophicus]|jgi:hypothetical protein|uniref:Uncharacterized protein n=1 Tax=Candidatus Acididesulfobacter diazotrophicus TaxID=2597226 RepID=A0A519BK65_9DELT|nr:MAG: hypothetical protein EVG15_10050 [Candidatus Acididesulfobacter diazotrophicus]